MFDFVFFDLDGLDAGLEALHAALEGLLGPGHGRDGAVV